MFRDVWIELKIYGVEGRKREGESVELFVWFMIRIYIK